jgi:hypothetical protein
MNITFGETWCKVFKSIKVAIEGLGYRLLPFFELLAPTREQDFMSELNEKARIICSNPARTGISSLIGTANLSMILEILLVK